MAAKKELKIQPIEFPKYSPDLNPLDFYVWSEVQRRMNLKTPKTETAKDCMARLRRTAMALPRATVRKAVLAIRTRAAAVVAAKGKDISRD
jgi:transposase